LERATGAIRYDDLDSGAQPWLPLPFPLLPVAFVLAFGLPPFAFALALLPPFPFPFPFPLPLPGVPVVAVLVVVGLFWPGAEPDCPGVEPVCPGAVPERPGDDVVGATVVAVVTEAQNCSTV
jgi:hypothetical protein